jgi:hypothetical protein
VHLLKAGRFDGNYAANVASFHWPELYRRSPYLLRGFADQLARDYSFVIIDSRTGLTDTSGICAMLMPEILITVFTPNLQNLSGVIDLVREAARYRAKSDDLRPLVVYPLPSRIEASEPALRRRWRFGDSSGGVPGFQPAFEDVFKDIYELPGCDLNSYFDDVQIQHVPRYAYGEEIAVLVEETRDRFSMTQSYLRFSDRVMRGDTPWAGFEPDTAPFSGMKVLLAAKEPDIELEWKSLRNLLLNDGVEVLPTYYENDAEYFTALRAGFEKANLFVQLLSPVDEANHWIERQGEPTRAELAFDAAAARKIPILQWRKPILKRQALRHWNKELLEGPDVHAGGLEEFKLAVRDKLNRLAKLAMSKAAPPDQPYLYIVADKPDWGLARDLQAAARGEAIVDVMAAAEEDRRKEFEEVINIATAIVFLHGAASGHFIEAWLKQYARKTRHLGYNQRPRLVALYRAPPPKTPDEEPLVPFAELRTFGSSEEFTVDGIKQICVELGRGTST